MPLGSYLPISTGLTGFTRSQPVQPWFPVPPAAGSNSCCSTKKTSRHQPALSSSCCSYVLPVHVRVTPAPAPPLLFLLLLLLLLLLFLTCSTLGSSGLVGRDEPVLELSPVGTLVIQLGTEPCHQRTAVWTVVTQPALSWRHGPKKPEQSSFLNDHECSVKPESLTW